MTTKLNEMKFSTYRLYRPRDQFSKKDFKKIPLLILIHPQLNIPQNKFERRHKLPSSQECYCNNRGNILKYTKTKLKNRCELQFPFAILDLDDSYCINKPLSLSLSLSQMVFYISTFYYKSLLVSASVILLIAQLKVFAYE